MFLEDLPNLKRKNEPQENCKKRSLLEDQCLRHNLGYKKKIIQFIQRNQVYFSSSNVSTDTTVIVKDYMLSEKFTFCFKITIKFHHEIDKLKSILYKNSYPRDLVDKCIKEFLDEILAPKPVVSAAPKKNLVIGLPYLGKLSLQIRTRIHRIMKNKLPYCNIRFVFQPKCKISNFLHLKTKFHRSYFLALFTNFSVVAAMLPIMAKLSVILKSECANIWEFLHSLGKELKVMMIPPLKNIF